MIWYSLDFLRFMWPTSWVIQQWRHTFKKVKFQAYAVVSFTSVKLPKVVIWNLVFHNYQWNFDLIFEWPLTLIKKLIPFELNVLTQKCPIPIDCPHRVRIPTQADFWNLEGVFVFFVDLIDEGVHRLQVLHPHHRLVRPQRKQRVRPETDDTYEKIFSIC